MNEKNEELHTSGIIQKSSKRKTICNRSGHRVELIIEGKLVVLTPKQCITVPWDFDVPNGIGLHVR